MIDARRMEVYTAVYSPEGVRQTDISPVILDENSFADLFAAGPVVVIGDAAEKFAAQKGVGAVNEVPPEAGSRYADSFRQTCPEATAMLIPATGKYEKKEFEDIAYFEPFYLKQFIATTPKKLF